MDEVFYDKGGTFPLKRCSFTQSRRNANLVSKNYAIVYSGHGMIRRESNLISMKPVSGEGRRRSTIGVHLEFSEALHLRSSITHPKTDFSKS